MVRKNVQPIASTDHVKIYRKLFYLVSLYLSGHCACLNCYEIIRQNKRRGYVFYLIVTIHIFFWIINKF